MDTKYGIRRLSTEWANDGTKNFVGTKEEMTTLVRCWNVPQGYKYTVIPYNGENGVPPPFPSQPENPRNSRMKR